MSLKSWATALVLSYLNRGHLVEGESPFRIIIDGGSTGSRLHIFEFQHSHISNSTTCLRRGSARANVPLSTFARVPENLTSDHDNHHRSLTPLNSTHVAQHLIPLFTYAADIIPQQYHSQTTVQYQATAGMRLIDEQEQDAVYDALYYGLITNPDFPFTSLKRQDIATLSGDLEGYYGAIAANYLKGVIDVNLHIISSKNTTNNIHDHTHNLGNNTVNNETQSTFHHHEGPLGALDMGGASLQIVYSYHNSDSIHNHDIDFESCSSDLPVLDSDYQFQNVHTSISKQYDLPTNTVVSMDDNEMTCINPYTGIHPKQNKRRLESDQFFSTSYLSYGVDQFRERLWNTWINDHETCSSQSYMCMTNLIYNPCSFHGYIMEWEGYTFIGTGNAHECTKEINRLIPHEDDALQDYDDRLPQEENQSNTIIQDDNYTNNTDKNLRKKVGGIEHPPIRGKFYAMSLFFFTLDCLRELSNDDELNVSWPTPTIRELSNALDKLCSRHWFGDLEYFQHENSHAFTRAEVLPHRCFESVYMVTLLRDGFGFHPSSNDITFSYLIEDSEVEWSLGMALASFASEVNPAVSYADSFTIYEEEDDTGDFD